jgi:hypothetical protein
MQMLYAARRRAKASRVPFNIDVSDIVIPKKCPALGIPLKTGGGRGHFPNRPSLDRLVPALGYTKGNVVVISTRANAIKNDATPVELEAIAAWLRFAFRRPH